MKFAAEACNFAGPHVILGDLSQSSDISIVWVSFGA